VRRPSSSSPSSSSNHSFDVLVDEVLFDDPIEERIEAEIVAHLFRGAAPEAYRQAVAQQEALRAKKAAQGGGEPGAGAEAQGVHGPAEDRVHGAAGGAPAGAPTPEQGVLR
jgi:hypothetical protein